MQPTQEQPLASEAESAGTEIKQGNIPMSTGSDSEERIRKKRIVVILTAAFGVLLVLAVAVGCRIFLDQTVNQKEPSLIDGDSATSEAEITDPVILRDLDEKIAILHNSDQTGKLIEKQVGTDFNVIRMYEAGNLEPLETRVVYIIHSLGEGATRLLTQEEKNSAWEESGLPSEYVAAFMAQLQYGVDGEAVANRYKDVFGSRLSVESYKGEDCFYRYDSAFNFFYTAPVGGGCGGDSPFISYHYKTQYTWEGDYAYVYVSGAVLRADTGDVYCGVPVDEDNAVCENVGENGAFTINAENYQKFAMYRFVFKMGSGGLYHFVKVEPIG